MGSLLSRRHSNRMTSDTFLFVLSLAWLAVLIGTAIFVIFD
jgi:hypothetical protein